jgi:hypothetical protein
MKSRHGITGCLKVTPELPANRTELGFWPTVSGQQVKIRVGDGLPTNHPELDFLLYLIADSKSLHAVSSVS